MRVRWGNVGRAAVVLALVGVAVVWPRLEGGAPRLPSDAAVPVGGASGEDAAGGNGSGEAAVRAGGAAGAGEDGCG